MGALLGTFVNITLLRSGPEAIPPSWLLFVAAVMLRSLALALGVALVPDFSAASVKADLVLWSIGLICFGALVIATGKSARLAQTLTALVGIGAVVTFVMLFALVIGSPFFDRDSVTTVAQLLLLWSVVVKGHIMARALDWHWYGGLLVSVGVLLFQSVASDALLSGQ